MNIVATQTRDNLTLEACLLSDKISKTKYTPAEMDNTTRQATTSKQLEILFKHIVVLFSGDVTFLRRTSLEILNSLKLRYSNGGNTMIRKIIDATVQEMIMLFVDIR